ncbi:MAG: DegT/DnrJ/EryC1/StrS family aminotransferase [Pseudomonadota bacterium]
MLAVEPREVLFPSDTQLRYYSLARYALIDALHLAGIGHGSRVLLPGYLCRDLLAPLHLLGALACWYEVAPDLSPAQSPELWPQADAVLAINYFGFAQDLRPFQSYAQRTGAVLIEDNAHGYLSRDQDGCWLGCRATLGLFSLRKTLRIPDGAVLWFSALPSTRTIPQQLPFSGHGLNPAQLSKARLRRLPLIGETLYRSSIALARWLRKQRTGSATPTTDPNSEYLVPGSPQPWSGLRAALAACVASREIERRRTAYLRCAEIGVRVGARPIFSHLPDYCAPYAFAFRADQTALDAMRRYAAEQGFDLVSWPDLPEEIVSQAPTHYCNVFLINFLW